MEEEEDEDEEDVSHVKGVKPCVYNKVDACFVAKVESVLLAATRRGVKREE